MATYSERIRELRILHEMSQQDLADRHALDDIHLEMSQKAVSAFQNSFQPN